MAGNYVDSASMGGYGGMGGLGGLGGLGLVGLVGINSLGLGGRDGDCGKTVALEQTIATLQGLNSNQNAITAAIGAVDIRLEAAIAGVAKEVCDLSSTLLTAIAVASQSGKDQATAFRFGDLERELAVAQNGGPIVRAGTFVQCDPCGHKEVK